MALAVPAQDPQPEKLAPYYPTPETVVQKMLELGELKAGEISMHNDLLLHGSEANRSTRRRCGLTLRYCSADVRAYEGWNAKGVVVSGTDPSGHWANPPRPNGEPRP